MKIMFFWAKKKDTKVFVILSLILILLIVLLLVVSWFVFDIYRNQNRKLNQPAFENKNLNTKEEFLDLSNKDPEVGGIVEKVSRHILLPATQFTVATVKDASSLLKENPVLYQYLKNGQKVLLYDTGAIVYDQEVDKIVDIIQFYAARQEKFFNK